MDKETAEKNLELLNLFFEIQRIIRELPFDPAGHQLAWSKEKGNMSPDWQRFSVQFEETDPPGIPRMVAPHESVSKLENMLRIVTGEAEGETLITSGSYSTQCYVCGERVAIVSREKKLFAQTPCRYSDGIPLEFELNVPSGKIVVANDLRPAFSIFGDYDVNTTMGCVQTTKAMEKIGCAHAFVGNTCPGMYHVGENRYIIASGGHDWRKDIQIDPPGEHVAGIITDLWWYSIADYDEYRRRVPDEKQHDFDLVQVKPGVYRFKHLRHLRSFKENIKKPCVYTEIEWVRPPDSVKDFQAEIMAKNFTAGQVIGHMLEREYFKNMPDAVKFAAEFIFCVIGNGASWHPNGFAVFDPDMPENLSEVEIPAFEKPYRWYPLSKYSALCCAAGIGDEEITLNPTFAKLAINVARCIAEHGVLAKPEEEKEAERTRALAQQCLKKLLERYPEKQG